jgi:hypothetical protein
MLVNCSAVENGLRESLGVGDEAYHVISLLTAAHRSPQFTVTPEQFV